MTKTKMTPNLSRLLRGVALLCACLALRCGGELPTVGELAERPAELALSPSNPQIAQGTAQPFSLRGIYADGRARELQGLASWQVVDPQGVAVAMPADGNLELEQPGSYLVTARYGDRTLSTRLVVTAATLKSVAISPSSPKVGKGATQAFAATASFSDGTTQDVSKLTTWAVKDVLGTGVATIDTTGLLFAKSVGKATITARYKTKSSSTTVEVTAATLSSLAVNPAEPTIAVGTNQRFSAIGSYSDGTTADLTAAVTWAVTDLMGAGVAAIDGTGLANGKAVGKAEVTADFSGFSGSTTLTVTPAVPVSVAVSPLSSSIAKGSGRRFIATATLSDGSTQDVSSMVAWTATDRTGSGVASIDSSGLARGNAIGTATIGCSYRGNTATALLEVTAAVLSSLQLSPATATVPKGTTVALSAIGFYSDGSSQNLSAMASWSAVDLVGSGVASVAAGGTVRGKAVGKATITASVGGLTASAVVEVVAPTYTGLIVDPPFGASTVGGTLQLSAIATRTDGSTVDVTKLTTWSLDTIGALLFTIDKNGLLSTPTSGFGNVTASFAGLTATSLVFAL